MVALSGVIDMRLSEEFGLFCVSVEEVPAKVLEVRNRPVTPVKFSPVVLHVGVLTCEADYSGNLHRELQMPQSHYATRMRFMKLLSPVRRN